VAKRRRSLGGGVGEGVFFQVNLFIPNPMMGEKKKFNWGSKITGG